MDSIDNLSYVIVETCFGAFFAGYASYTDGSTVVMKNAINLSIGYDDIRSGIISKDLFECISGELKCIEVLNAKTIYHVTDKAKNAIINSGKQINDIDEDK